MAKRSVLAVLDDVNNSVLRPNGGCYSEELAEARDTVAAVITALMAYDQWNYEVESARVNGESVYSYDELRAMRVNAAALGDVALKRAQGGAA